MTERKSNKQLRISVKDIENEKLKKNLKRYNVLLKKFQIKKLMFFKNQLKKFKNDENYQFKNILVERHFFVQSNSRNK